MLNTNNTHELFKSLVVKISKRESFFSPNKVFTTDLINIVNDIYFLNGLGNDELSKREDEGGWKSDNEYNQLTSNHEKKLHIQFSKNESSLVKELVANIMWIYHLGPQLSSKTKKEQIQKWLRSDDTGNRNFEIPDGLASYGFLFQSKNGDFRFIIVWLYYLISQKVEENKIVKKTVGLILKLRELSTYLKSNKNATIEQFLKQNANDPTFSLPIQDDVFFKEIDNDNFYQGFEKNVPLVNMVLHLCDSDRYEPIAANNTKAKIARNLSPFFLKQKWNGGNIDDALIGIKKEIKKNIKYGPLFEEDNKHFFAPEIEKLWKNEYVANTYEILTNYQKQVILYGAPGTGKTYNAERAIEEFLDNSNFDKNRLFNDNELDLGKIKFSEYEKKQDSDNFQSKFIFNLQNSVINDTPVIWEIIQFNQTYSYEDFIEGMIPENGGSIGIKDGIFKRFVKAANKNREIDFILIIDEINRGKIDKIFGELLYLLEYRNSSVRLHYSGEGFLIPNNIYLIGTMNTADKSIAALDVALRRRFWFVKLDPNREVLLKEFGLNDDDWKKLINSDPEPIKVKKIAIKLFDWLNKDGGRLEDVLKDDANELKIGHTYFLKLNELKDSEGYKREPEFKDLINIWFYSIIPLLEEYVGFDKKMLTELLDKLSGQGKFTLENIKGLK